MFNVVKSKISGTYRNFLLVVSLNFPGIRRSGIHRGVNICVEYRPGAGLGSRAGCNWLHLYWGTGEGRVRSWVTLLCGTKSTNNCCIRASS